MYYHKGTLSRLGGTCLFYDTDDRLINQFIFTYYQPCGHQYIYTYSAVFFWGSFLWWNGGYPLGYMHMRRLATIIQWSKCSYGGDTGYSIRPKNTGDMNLDVTIFTAYVCVYINLNFLAGGKYFRTHTRPLTLSIGPIVFRVRQCGSRSPLLWLWRTVPSEGTYVRKWEMEGTNFGGKHTLHWGVL